MVLAKMLNGHATGGYPTVLVCTVLLQKSDFCTNIGVKRAPLSGVLPDLSHRDSQSARVCIHVLDSAGWISNDGKASYHQYLEKILGCIVGHHNLWLSCLRGGH